MKRGKDDDKIMGPMFPRLHVNDAEKGGPRAPPRNKMALYEQLSIPTQRFNHAAFPPSSDNSNLVPPVSSSQGSGRERNFLFPRPVQPPTASHQVEKFHGRQPAGATLNSHLPQLEERKKDPNSRHETRHQGEENPKICISNRDQSVKSSANLSARDRVDGLAKEASALPIQEFVDLPGSYFSGLNDSYVSLQHESGAGLQQNDRGHCDGDESGRDIEKEIVPKTRSGACTREEHSSPSEPVIDNDYHGTNTCGSLKFRNGDKSDDVSETSMVDCISGLDITPDDVVGIIGQKHFWKARKAITNQQRVFAVQVFELHRLIKVQQLIAGSPHLLLEDSPYLGKSSLIASPAKKLLPEYVVKPLPHIIKCKDDSEKPLHKMECSAENAVGKTFLSSLKKGSQPSNYGPYLANPPSAAMAGDSRIGPWCFHQSPGHQWLVPIMSPSEGLIYKPYPGHGFMGAGCGTRCGPFGPTPETGNFMNPAIGMPSPHHHQEIGVIPGAHPVGHNYFPPYGMPIMNPSISGLATEQDNQFAGHGPHGQNGQLSGGGANFNMQRESSCNVPAQKSGAIPQVMKFRASKDTELQGSTASSPGERTQGEGRGPAVEGRDSLPLFKKAPVDQERVPQPHDTDQPTKVIKVVPHNPRSATESAARIFQSIQQERKQYDSI
ncbi:protein HEADING DATE 3B-like isoform X2 [Pistacia vera]|uniref:protein HEADING DATE 3B isoform X2 n=1 Tax=Pistacia vera TaxID=55513 RepID=UPI001262BBE5|nr:protein HEADING DATE 3B isoform X2 [Pistacia vera]XP_031250283.1 protein HEADING DATE 3B-like isoform X2 [Pistacia vera]